MTKQFASAGDLAEKTVSFTEIGPGLYAFTAEGDPNTGVIVGDDSVMVIDTQATPAMAQKVIEHIRRVTDKPVKHVVLSHYHAVRVLGASAFDAEVIIAHDKTRGLIAERGKQDWESEFGRMPRLFKEPDSIPGLTWPTQTFSDSVSIDLGGGRGMLELRYLGRGHTEGDIVAWLPQQKIVFAGDLVEAQAALYTGDAFHRDWSGSTLDNVSALQAQTLVGGRGAVARGRDAVEAAIGQTRHFLDAMIEQVSAVRSRGGTLKEAFEASRAALVERYGGWPIFEHCLPFDVSRVWDELSGVERPVIWTAERDREIWDQLQD
jgi:glyoxylase-like metal-dependent hydrolase (beta-lactamase superfamily II)